jgi:hypothetical protein
MQNAWDTLSDAFNQSVQLDTSRLLRVQNQHDQHYPGFHASPQQQQSSRSSQRHNIHVLFLNDSKDDHLLNRLTSMLGRRIHRQGFCHVEIAIPDCESPIPNQFLSSSIYNGETVTLTRTKTFANPGYTVVTFTVDGNELAGITQYLHESNRMQLGFNAMGMYMAALPFQVGPSSTRRTFCSKHVVTALKAAGTIEAVHGLNGNIVTPSKLHRVLQERLRKDRFVVGSVQYKTNALMQTGAMFSVE